MWTRHDIMFRPTLDEVAVIGIFLQGFFYGIYSGTFAMYLQYWQASQKDTTKTQTIIFYSICTLYVLSVALFVSDILNAVIQLFGSMDSARTVLNIGFLQTTLFGCCDFIAQFILIYRCWIVWGRNTRVVIIPSILALAFLATWLACSESDYILSGQIVAPGWEAPMVLSSLAISLTVNALVTSLIVFRIFKVFRKVKTTSDDKILGITGGGKLRRTIFILIESGMALFSIQLVRLVVSILWTDAGMRAYFIVVPIHEMLNGIAPTIILVRIAMGLSFGDEKSMEEFAVESLRFVSSNPNSVPETGSIGIVDQDRRDDDDIGIQIFNQ